MLQGKPSVFANSWLDMLLINKHSARFRPALPDAKCQRGMFISVFYDEIIIILAPMNLTKEMTNEFIAAREASELRSLADIHAKHNNPGRDTWREARKEFVEFGGEVKGFLALSVRGELFWISHFDVDYLKGLEENVGV